MGKWDFGSVFKLKRGLGLMDWMMLKTVKAGEYLVFEGVAIVVTVL